MMEAALLIALAYEAPAECPRQEQLWSRVARAAPELRLAQPHEALRSYRIVVAAAPSGFVGELREAARPAPRVLEAADCAELVEALALMLVLSTEQDAVASSTAAPAPAPAPALTLATASSPPSFGAEPADVHDTPPRDAPSPSGAAFVGGLSWFGAAPDVLLGLTTGAERRFGPVIVGRLEARIAFGSERADATFYGLAPQFCARRGWSMLELSACAGVVAGVLDVKAVEYSGGAQSSGWLAPLLGVRVGALLGDTMVLEASAEGQHGFIERAYHVKSDDSEFATPPFSAVLTLALGARF
jgi:hypothetical protein